MISRPCEAHWRTCCPDRVASSLGQPGHPTWQLKQRHEKPSVRGRRFMTSAVDAHILLTLADSAVALATSDVASAVASAVEQGATITLTPPVTSAAVAAAAAISQPAPPPDVFQTAAWALLRGGAAGSIAALALQALRKGAPADGEEEEMEAHTLRDIPRLAGAALVTALRRPAALLLPASAVLYCLRCAGEVAAAALAASDGAISQAADPTAAALARADQLVTAGASSALTVLLFWVLIRWKEEVLKLVASSPDTPEDVIIITGPLSTLISVGLALAGGLSVASSFGINLEPVMAVGGISTVILGFGSQIVTTNAISGADLYFSNTFNKGDRVVLMTAGGDTVVTGYVEVIGLLYTVIRNEQGAPVSIPNKAVAEMLVKNETRIKFSSAITGFKHPRQLLYSFRVRLQDRDKVNDILERLQQLFPGDPDVDLALPAAAWLGGFGDYYIELGMLVHSTGRAASNWGGFRQRWLQTVEAVVRAAGAQVPVPTTVLYSAAAAAQGPPSTAGADSGSSGLLTPRSSPEASAPITQPALGSGSGIDGSSSGGSGGSTGGGGDGVHSGDGGDDSDGDSGDRGSIDGSGHGSSADGSDAAGTHLAS